MITSRRAPGGPTGGRASPPGTSAVGLRLAPATLDGVFIPAGPPARGGEGLARDIAEARGPLEAALARQDARAADALRVCYPRA